LLGRNAAVAEKVIDTCIDRDYAVEHARLRIAIETNENLTHRHPGFY
jgi:hypothetical protein